MFRIEFQDGMGQWSPDVGDANCFETRADAEAGIEALRETGDDECKATSYRVAEIDFASNVQRRLDEIQDADGLPRKTRAVCNEAVDTRRPDGGWGRVRIEDGVGEQWEGLASEALDLLADCEHDDCEDDKGRPFPLASIFEALRRPA